MTDIGILTLVIGCLGLLILHKMPETDDFYNWSILRLTFDLALSGILMFGVIIPLVYIVMKAGLLMS